MLNPKYKISNMAKDLGVKGKDITDILGCFQQSGADGCNEEHVEHHGKAKNARVGSNGFAPNGHTCCTIGQINTGSKNRYTQKPDCLMVRNMNQCGKQCRAQQHKGNHHKKQTDISLGLALLHHIPFKINTCPQIYTKQHLLNGNVIVETRVHFCLHKKFTRHERHKSPVQCKTELGF